ncbi:MAG: PAS domain S-box protein [Marinilabiliales bacterium]|nr:MAG: PAS domain S-box protein [Marinilabiliales bacterium]
MKRIIKDRDAKEEHELLKYIIDHTRSSVAIHDTDMNYIYVSQRYYDDMHLSERNIIGRNHYEVFPALPDHIKEAHSRALKGEVVSADDEPMYWPDGRTDWAHWQCRPWYGADKSLGGIIVYIEIITERKKSELALQENEEKYRMLFENNPIPMFVYDLETMAFLGVNNAAVTRYGYSKEEFMAMTLKDIHPKEDIERLEKNVSAVSEGLDEAGVWRHYKKDGSLIFAEIVSHTIEFEKRRAEIVLATDVTEQKLAEAEVQYQQLMISEMGRVAKIGGWEFDALTGEGTWTDETARIHDLDPKEETNVEKAISFYKPGSRERVIKAVREAVELGKEYSLELEIISAKGKEKWVQTIGKPITENGKVVKVRGSFQDITERKKIQEDLVKAKEKAEESDRLKTAFLNNISHEIRTPMNAIIGFSALLSQPELEDDIKKTYVDTLSHSSNQLLAIINDIVDISSIEAGIVKLSKDEVRINDLLKRLEEQFSLLADKKGILLRSVLALPDNEALLISDRTRLTQILSNLLNNAFKYTREGTIEFGYRPAKKSIEFYVSDTGIGIPSGQLTRIFERFYQAGSDISGINEGTGLGLSISKAFVEMMGGQIWAVSEPGKGSRFIFTLPFKKPDDSVVAVHAEKQDSAFEREYHILVAEDDAMNAQLILNFLDVPNLMVTLVNNGAEAVEHFRSGKPADLVLMDLNMPVMDGYEATRLIREQNPDLPVVAQTAFALSDDREKALSSGCNDLITKPFRRDALLSKIREFVVF